MEKAVSAKIMRPSLSGVVQRKRLFSLLDGKLTKPVIWVSSPAGSGKTRLVSSYLDSRKFPYIWYQCDGGDSDLATFFYYMGLAAKAAAPRSKKSLPLLAPEYASDIPTFTRRYFEKLYSRLVTRHGAHGKDSGSFIVLDNYQDVPADSPFNETMANGFDMIPEGVHVMVISRSEPPAPFARLQANDKINIVEFKDIRFTFEESKGLLRGRMPRLDDETIKRMQQRAEGWAAGIILMLERERLRGTAAEPVMDFEYERVFEYFAGEIFEKTEKGIQDFLLKTAFLPVLSVPLAESLTGVGNVGRILASLSRSNYFTERLSGSGQDYRYHPLFRDFLLNRAKMRLAPAELVATQRETALLLEQSGQIEDAARLYNDSGEGHLLALMVIHHAREFLRQGRNKTVEEWIAGIPDEAKGDNPWLLYWAGMCAFPFDMARTRDYLEKAFASFKAKDDTSGIYLSWAGIVDTYLFELDEWKRLDVCIAALDDLRRAYPSFPSEEIDLIASSRMLISLVVRKTDEPKWVLRWFDRVSALLQKNPSVDIQMDTVFFMSLYYLWKGEYHKNIMLLERAEAGIPDSMPSPFSVIRIKMMKGIHYWVTAQYDTALTALSEGHDVAEKYGVHVFDSLLWSFRAAAEMARGTGNAEAALRKQMTASHGAGKALGLYFHHMNAAWHALLTGNASLAAENMEAIATRVANIGTPYYKALWNIGMAQVAFAQGRADAKAYIREAHRISRNMKSPVLEWYSLLVSAYFLFVEGEEAKGLLSLRRGLALGKRYDYVHLEFYQPSVAQFLYAKALEERIEPEYVKGLIRKLRLTPPARSADSAVAPEDWPYPVKVLTLGRFEIIKDGEPLLFAGKVQKKPLELLKALISFGCANVPAERLTDALWPDADGDLARKSFEMTLSRLRRLLGEDDFVKYRAGQLSIDLLSCWVDSIAFEHIVGKIKKYPDDQASVLCEKALVLYKGPFLSSDVDLHWAAHRRETLKNGLLRTIIITGRHYEATGQWERAVDYYLKGLDTDDLAEEFYQRLMVCYQKLGNNAEAVRIYHRCRSLLEENLGIGPSAGTQAIYSSMLQKP